MKFQIKGADRETGKERVENIEAESPQQAEAIARRKGVMIESLYPVATSDATGVLNYHSGVSDRPLWYRFGRATYRALWAVVGSAPKPAARETQEPPDYMGLAFFAWVTRVTASILALIIVFGIPAVLTGEGFHPTDGSMDGISKLGLIIASFVVCVGLSSGAAALRDTARATARMKQGTRPG